MHAEIGGGNIAQRAAKRAERRAHAAEENYVFDFHDYLHFLELFKPLILANAR
jgi:hypothetical protein